MGLVKRTYVDGETVIIAQNLNDIQDAIIQNASDISTKGTYSKPSGGIPSTDMTTAVQTSLGKADSAYQKPSGGIPSTDLASAVQTSLGKADTAYQKPSGGIPSTDLASAVQTSLGKADTALQSSDIDSTLTVAGKAADAKATGDEISGVKNTLNQLVRPNLLDNWYFNYGKTIDSSNPYSNDGTFPVNQRGQQGYLNFSNAYGIDRWALSGTMYINSNATIGFTGANSPVLLQRFEKPQKLKGKTLTISALGWTDTANSFYLSLLINDSWALNVPLKTTNDCVYAVIDLAPYGEISKFEFNVVNWISNANCYLYAAKVEIGSGQTLAHQENGVWVLNEIPNYAEELAKCQRYYEKISTMAIGRGSSLFEFVYFKADKAREPSITVKSHNGNPGYISYWDNSNWQELAITNTMLSNLSTPTGKDGVIVIVYNIPVNDTACNFSVIASADL